MSNPCHRMNSSPNGYSEPGPQMSTHTLDCRRLLCPMPVIRVQDLVATLPVGDTVEAVCTDPGAMQDIPAWCRINGHEVVSRSENGDTYVVVVRVCGEAG